MSFEVLLIVILALIFLLQWLDGLDRERRKNREAAAKKEIQEKNDKQLQKSLEDLLKQLAKDPGNTEIHQKLLGSMKLQEDTKEAKAVNQTGKAYATVLGLLASEPTNQMLKQLALAAGRVHYGKIAGGVASLDDEQRIMNDIAVRS